MNIEKKQELVNKLCVNCSKFFGNETFAGLCSTCYKNANPTVVTKVSTKTQEPLPEVQVAVQPPPQPQTVPKQADPTRCYLCNKRVGYLGVNCKCSLVFCNTHRLPENHECTVDYRKLGHQKLSKEITKVAPSKITQI